MATSANPASRNRNARYAQELLDVVVLAAEKLRPGGTMVVTAGPGERDPLSAAGAPGWLAPTIRG